jgi:hypothetical protein
MRPWHTGTPNVISPLLRQLESETRQLTENLEQPDPEQAAWLREGTNRGDDR